MELLSLDVTAKLLNRTTQTVRNLVRRGELEAVYPKTGKSGRPNMMITVSSYGEYLVNSQKGKVSYE